MSGLIALGAAVAVITGIGAGHSLDFSFEIAALLFEKEVIEKVKEGMEIDLVKG